MSNRPTCRRCNEPEMFCTCPTEAQAAEKAEEPRAFDVTRLVPNDAFGKASVALIRRAMAIGWDAALKEQAREPSIDDPIWYDTIEAMMEGKPFPAPTTNDVQRLSWCTSCGDSGVVPMKRRRKNAHSQIEYETVRPCFCEKGASYSRWMKRGVHVSASKEKNDDGPDPKSGFKLLKYNPDDE